MLDLLLPATDSGVAFQFGLLLVVAATGAWFARHNKDYLRLIIGLTLLIAGLMAIRAIH
jgi:cytochrome c biogenesis protein CcdA